MFEHARMPLRYLAEFDFRYNHCVANGVDDNGRAARALASISGKRITYRQLDNFPKA